MHQPLPGQLQHLLLEGADQHHGGEHGAEKGRIGRIPVVTGGGQLTPGGGGLQVGMGRHHGSSENTKERDKEGRAIAQLPGSAVCQSLTGVVRS